MDHKAEECKVKAEKELSRFFGGQSKYENARELFRQAGNYYKAAQQWRSAADAYQRAQELSAKLKEELDMLEDMTNVANCLSKSENHKEARTAYEKVIQVHLERGKNSEAAKFCNQLGQNCELRREFSEAIQWYRKAAQYYKRENSLQTGRQIESKVANILALEGNYKEAIELYETLGREYASDPLLRLNARYQFFLACLCHAANIMPEVKEEGIATLEETLQHYMLLDPIFSASTWEHKLIQGIIEAFSLNDVEALRSVMNEYEEVNSLDEGKTKLFGRIKDVLKKSLQDER